MRLIDSHAHFDEFAKDGRIPEVLQSASDAGVVATIAIGGGVDANRTVLNVVADNPDVVSGALGFDRYAVGTEIDIDELRRQLDTPGIVAVGETGLDYYYSNDTAEEQKALFKSMLDVSAELSLPVVVHSREADDDTCDLLREHADAWQGDTAPGVLHCFTGSQAFADRLLALGYMISVSGIITFKNAEELRKVAAVIPDDRILIETDAPYLAPIPYRGKQNEPSYVTHVAAKLAEVRNVAVEDIARITSVNAESLFGLEWFK